MYPLATQDRPDSASAKRRLEWLRVPCQYAVFYGGWLYFGLASLAYSVGAALLYAVMPRAAAARIGRPGIGWNFRVYLSLLQFAGILRLDASALDALRGERGVIVAPNHPSLWDAVFVISRLPHVACIMKAEIWDSAFLGGGARLAGYIRNDSPMNMIKASVAELRAGHQLLVFPEGTRTRRKPANAFKGGFALIAKKARAPIQTVFIETDSPFLNKGWPWFKKPPLPMTYRLRLGRRFEVSGDVNQFVSELESYYRQELGA